jgi:hypothetical protein
LERQGKDELKAIDFYSASLSSRLSFVCVFLSTSALAYINLSEASMSCMKVRRCFIRRCTFLELKCGYNFVLPNDEKLESMLCVQALDKMKSVLSINCFVIFHFVGALCFRFVL